MAILVKTETGDRHFLKGNDVLKALADLQAAEGGSGWWSPRDFLEEITIIRAKKVESIRRVEDEGVKELLSQLQAAQSKLVKVH
jgi:hypothetical protein